MTKTKWKLISISLLLITVAGAHATGQIPAGGDLVFGLDGTNGTDTLELVRGPAALDGGMSVPTFWDNPRVASVSFDNFAGVQHNANGNLLAVDFGGPGASGNIYSLSTTNPAQPTGQLIGDTGGLGGSGLAFTTRLSSITVSPDNTKIAVMGYDPGNVIVYDYQAGDSMGMGASLSGARDTAAFMTPTDTQGLTWLDNNTLVSYDTTGGLWTIDATSMATTFQSFIDPGAIGSDYTSLYYNPEVSDMIWAGYSGFDGTASQSRLFVIDPSDFSLQHTVDLSMSGESIREMAMDASGNLYYATFGSNIELILGAAANPTGIANDSGIDWYTSGIFDAFPGMDIGFSPIDCDFNNDGNCDIVDMDELTGAITAGNPDVSLYDLNGDGMVTILDVNEWRSQAGARNLLSGDPYLVGDANLDGTVDGQDFIDWNTNKFSATGVWSEGDFNVDGVTDGQDFVLWNTNKFTSADGVAVPEPSYGLCSLLAALLLAGLRRR